MTWISSIASQIMDAVSGLFLNALGTDMVTMEEYFPFITKAFDVMQYTAWAVLFLIVVWQLFRAFGGPIIHGVSFTAKAGTVTALVGPSGSGKSTLAKLIARFWDVSAGAVTVGGADIRNLPLSELSEKISYVSQDNFLFNMSLRDNIRIGKPDATDAEVERAASLARCDDFIARFPKGYDTNAGDAGARLSGGERQRLAIARAILKDAPIIILDEATAFTDPENEDKLQQSIDHLTKGKTLIVIAHRLSTIMYADKILVLEDGAISAEGTHEQLLSSSQTYLDMWKAHISAMDWSMNKEAEILC